MGMLLKVFLFLGISAAGVFYSLGEEDRAELLSILGTSGRAVASDAASSVVTQTKKIHAEAAPIIRARAAEIVLKKK
jgi:hypothetical protein